MWVNIWLFFVFVNQSFASLEAPRNRTTGGRVFSLFSIVQFPNEACSTTSAVYSNGTCYTATECSANGGSAQGNCAAGFGVCCVFFYSASDSTITQNCSYITNPGYPSNYATAGTLSYTISKSQDDICRIRLDYDLFVLTTPATVTTIGQCTTDRMTIATTGQTTTPTSATAGLYGAYPMLCGTQTGYHSYVDLSSTSTDSATLSFVLGDTTVNQYKVKVTQYSCNDPGITIQNGCFQYFTGVTGTIDSYNFANSAQLATLEYNNCIRQEEGYCCIEYSVISFTLGAITCANAAANRCSGASLCVSEYITIPQVVTNQPPANYDRFCGVNLNPVGFPAINLPMTSCEIPFNLGYNTGRTTLVSAPPAQVGFSLSYKQLAGNC